MSNLKCVFVLGSVAVLLSSFGGPLEIGLNKNNFKEMTMKIITTTDMAQTHQQYFLHLSQLWVSSPPNRELPPIIGALLLLLFVCC